MVTNQKNTGRAKSIPAGLALGTVVSLAVTLISVALLAYLVDHEYIPWENTGYGIMILVLLASFTGAKTAANSVKRQRLVVSLLMGFLYFGILLSITALFFGGQYHAVGVTSALVLAGSGAAGILGTREKRGGNRRKSPMRYR